MVQLRISSSADKPQPHPWCGLWQNASLTVIFLWYESGVVPTLANRQKGTLKVAGRGLTKTQTNCSQNHYHQHPTVCKRRDGLYHFTCVEWPRALGVKAAPKSVNTCKCCNNEKTRPFKRTFSKW